MGLIHRLPVHVQNQIAAGEVVERPASVVKELIENAIDAAAQSICIELEASGKRTIRVTDDGTGLDPEDAIMAVEKHTTSKIHREEDLCELTTLGFRGEALASIASISRMEVLTSPADAQTGIHIFMEGSTILDTAPAPPVRGTTVTVRDLFFNTPARKKFLKTDGTELFHILENITQQALVHPQIAFTITNNGRSVLKVPSVSAYEDRIRDLFGPDFLGRMREVKTPDDFPVKVHGFVSLKDHHASRRQQYLFINARPVRHTAISQMIYRATAPLRPEGRHPVYILYVELPAKTVDVNVHPMKREVRLSDNEPVLRSVNHAMLPLKAPTPFNPPSTGRSTDTSNSSRTGASQTYFQIQTPLSFAKEDSIAPSGIQQETPSPPPARPYLRFGAAFFAYPDGDGLTMVDQHAAHERVLYEKLLCRTVHPSPLLVPRRIELSPPEYEVVVQNTPVLSEMGFMIEPFGGSCVLIRQIPSDLTGRDVGRVLKDVVSHLVEERPPQKDFQTEVAALMACHEAVKARDDLKPTDMEHLLKQLETCSSPDQCPHGRPTRVHLSGADLAKLFKRN